MSLCFLSEVRDLGVTISLETVTSLATTIYGIKFYRGSNFTGSGRTIILKSINKIKIYYKLYHYDIENETGLL